MKTPTTLKLLLLLAAFAQRPVAFGAPPNVVVIVADDLGYADVRFNPQHPKEISTPHLDALAKQSVICRQGYVSGNVCSPTRAGLMTGRYQQRLGLYTGGEAGSGLPMSGKIFPQFLKPAGYVTGQFGKWHLGPTPEWSPARRGFDEVFGFLGRGAHDYFKLDDPEDPIYRGTEVVKESGYLTDRLGEETAAFITRHKARPFFAYLAFNAVHAPLQAPADEIAKFNTGNTDRNTLLAMGKRMDDAIGKIVATLKAEGVWENMLLFFISDNGGPLAQNADNTPLRGGKHQDYEGGIRVPAIARWPGRVPAASECTTPAITMDVYPTFLELAAASAPEKQPLDGVSLATLLTNPAAPLKRDTLHWHLPHYHHSTPASAIRRGDWKLIEFFEDGALELYDLRADPGEATNLAVREPARAKQLQAAVAAWRQQVGARMPVPNSNYDPARASQMAKGKNADQ